MPVRSQLKSFAATDMGRRRTNNEDRFLYEPEHGIYAVVDGVGGHAAGEHAAETAVEVLRERLTRPTGTPEERLREAIALANNEILRLAQATPEWTGMACVLTVAVVEDDLVTVGHVGDSRLYLARPGEIRKVTQDHSPVGEREDRGEITELAAMRHPRRNEIFRDVGTTERSPDEPSFIDIERFPLPVDGALLLCSDGLSDLVTSAEMLNLLESSAQDPEVAVQMLINAANAAGGKDNITVLVVTSPGFRGKPTGGPQAVAERTRPAPSGRTSGALLLGLLAGALAGAAGTYWFLQGTPEGPKTFTVSGSIAATLKQAHSGDMVVIPAGRYRERIEMVAGVKPFRGESADIVVEHAAMPVPPLDTSALAIPTSTWRAIERGLAKKPGDRFATCTDFAREVLRDLQPLRLDPNACRFLCPKCSAIIKLDRSRAGTEGRCLRCRSVLGVA
ncbi:MAG: hypothetical protein EBY17_00620, partial [Acidobacteriia bacterium]|nr:hypothetical protein [Terriglobia bacterium]